MGGKVSHSASSVPDKAPSFQLPVAQTERQRQRPGAEGNRPGGSRRGRGRRFQPSVPITLQGPLGGPRNLGIQQPGPQGKMGVPPPPQVWLGEGEGTWEGPRSGSWKARAGASLRSAVGLALRPPRPPFCPKES